jgi:opacity protein-like surface antigen
MMRTMGLCVLLAASATSAGAADVSEPEPPALVVEGGSVTALNSTVDLGLSVSFGTTLPKWVPVLGEHLAFVDALTVAGQEAIGASVSLQRWQTDDGWRIGATLTQPTDGGQREVRGYVRYGVRLW